MPRRLWPLVALVLTAGCALPSYVSTAYYGDLASLKREIQAASKSGKLSRSAVRDLASAVARREVRSARGEEALARIRESRTCISVVEPELVERTGTADDAGAEALLVLLESGRVAREPLVDRYARSPSGAWRAISARAATGRSHGGLRRAFYVDADERVRRSALRAAFEAADPDDLDALLDAARLDPDDFNRSLAMHAAGAIGGARTSMALTDLFANADSDARLSIVEAWALPRVYDAGGAQELVRLAETGGSLASVAAAGALVQANKSEASTGRAALARAIAEGTTDERMLAIEEAPISDADVTAALGKAADAPDPAVRAVALARELEIPLKKEKAKAALEVLAKEDNAAARQARAALAAVGDVAAAPLVQQDLYAADSSRRKEAALQLFQLGRPAWMAPALADGDPGVRMSVACAVAGAV